MPKTTTLRVDQVTLVYWLRAAADRYEDSAKAFRELAKTCGDSAHAARMTRDNESDRDRCNAMADAIDEGANLSIDGDLLLVRTR